MLCALAFLLPNDIVQGFEDLVDLIKANHNNNVEDLLEYFEENYYISRYRRNTRQHIAIILIELWIMFNRIDEELSRANNSVEGWHRNFQGHLTSCHPIFCKFLQVLQN